MTEPFIIDPTPSPEAESAAIICGHSAIQALGVEGMCEFHGFVQEVLETTIKPAAKHSHWLKSQIAAELYKAFERLEAPPELLSIIGSIRDTLSDDEVLRYLKDWNERQ